MKKEGSFHQRVALTLFALVLSASVAAAQCITGTNCSASMTGCNTNGPENCARDCTDLCGADPTAALTIDISAATCGHGTCVSTGCTLGVDFLDYTFTVTNNCASPRDIVWCVKVVDCASGTPLCSACADLTGVNALGAGASSGGSPHCFPVNAGNYQMIVEANDVSGGAGSCASCTTGGCTSSCVVTGGCNQSARAASCCIHIS